MIAVYCPNCNAPLPPEFLDVGQREGSCPACRKEQRVDLFPSAHATAQSLAPPPLPGPLAEGESSCFYSPARPATGLCAECGVFVSDLWSASWGKDTVCLKCIDRLRTPEGEGRFQQSRRLYDNLCLNLALIPILVLTVSMILSLPILGVATHNAQSILGGFFGLGMGFGGLLAIFTAPAALFVALRRWKSPRSLVPRSRWRFVLGTVLAGLQVLGLIASLMMTFVVEAFA